MQWMAEQLYLRNNTTYKHLIDTLSSGATLDLVHAQLTDLPSLCCFQVGQMAVCRLISVWVSQCYGHLKARQLAFIFSVPMVATPVFPTLWEPGPNRTTEETDLLEMT